MDAQATKLRDVQFEMWRIYFQKVTNDEGVEVSVNASLDYTFDENILPHVSEFLQGEVINNSLA
eukprot:12431075-Ditylum_brightwellii.AAC.1